MPRKKQQHPYTPFGDKLRSERERIRKYKDIKDFAKASGIGEAMMYKYEEGLTFPPIDNFIKICKTLNKPPEYMLSPLLDMNTKDRKILEIIDRVKIVCRIENNRNKLNGYLVALEQEMKEEKKG